MRSKEEVLESVRAVLGYDGLSDTLVGDISRIEDTYDKEMILDYTAQHTQKRCPRGMWTSREMPIDAVMNVLSQSDSRFDILVRNHNYSDLANYICGYILKHDGMYYWRFNKGVHSQEIPILSSMVLYVAPVTHPTYTASKFRWIAHTLEMNKGDYAGRVYATVLAMSSFHPSRAYLSATFYFLLSVPPVCPGVPIRTWSENRMQVVWGRLTEKERNKTTSLLEEWSQMPPPILTDPLELSA